MRAPSYNKTIFFGGRASLLDKKDPRIRSLPFPTRRATFREVQRVHEVLSTVHVYGKLNYILGIMTCYLLCCPPAGYNKYSVHNILMQGKTQTCLQFLVRLRRSGRKPSDTPVKPRSIRRKVRLPGYHVPYVFFIFFIKAVENKFVCCEMSLLLTASAEENHSSSDKEESVEIQLEMVEMTLGTLDLRESEICPSKQKRRRRKKKDTAKQSDGRPPLLSCQSRDWGCVL